MHYEKVIQKYKGDKQLCSGISNNVIIIICEKSVDPSNIYTKTSIPRYIYLIISTQHHTTLRFFKVFHLQNYNVNKNVIVILRCNSS